MEEPIHVYRSIGRTVTVGGVLKQRLEEAGRAEGCDTDYLAKRILRDRLDAHGLDFTPRADEIADRGGR